MPADRNAVVGDMRRFNRFYTGLIGLLEETLSHSGHTLAEARVLFELGRRPAAVAAGSTGKAGFLARAFHLDLGPAASELAGDLQLDPAYLTRILRKFAATGLAELCVDSGDPRRCIVSLTARGNAALAGLQAAADRDLARLTAGLTEKDASELSAALDRVTRLLAGTKSS